MRSYTQMIIGTTTVPHGMIHQPQVTAVPHGISHRPQAEIHSLKILFSCVYIVKHVR